MLPQLVDPHVGVEWIVPPVDDPAADWPPVADCALLQQPIDPQPPADESGDWWPDRCIP